MRAGRAEFGEHLPPQRGGVTGTEREQQVTRAQHRKFAARMIWFAQPHSFCPDTRFFSPHKESAARSSPAAAAVPVASAPAARGGAAAG